MLSVLTINIGAPAPQRATRLLDWLATRPEQVILLTETSPGPGTSQILTEFSRAGWAVVSTPDQGDRGAALVSRIPITSELTALSQVSIPGRIAAAILDAEPQTAVAAVYVPSRDRSQGKTERKQTFLASLSTALASLEDPIRHHLLLGGDYNVIARTHQPMHRGFLPFEFAFLEDLESAGFTDAHDHLHPGTQPYSWIGRTGDGYRYDYLHTGNALTDRLTSCTYLHETRDHRLTDHAALTATLTLDASELATTELASTRETTLF